VPGKTLIVGLGNPILCDDGVGWLVAARVRQALSEQTEYGSPPAASSIEVIEVSVGGLSLAEMLVGYERAIIVDAIMTGKMAPGSVCHLRVRDLPGTLNTASAHDTNLVTALQALRRHGAVLPPDEQIDVVAIEVKDVWTFSETCTPEVLAAVDKAVTLVLELVKLQVD
jgi:hydrogenase maturation protease